MEYRYMIDTSETLDKNLQQRGFPQSWADRSDLDSLFEKTWNNVHLKNRELLERRKEIEKDVNECVLIISNLKARDEIRNKEQIEANKKLLRKLENQYIELMSHNEVKFRNYDELSKKHKEFEKLGGHFV